MGFTPAQTLAIELRDHNILVSAAAGSGKTHTLIERILRLISDKENPTDISKMLIVTFTRAAAGELRTRLSKKLGEALALDPTNDLIASQLTSLTSAQICTIDSYCLDLIRSNFQLLSLPANFRLADETEINILKRDVMNQIIERRYETDESFGEFCDEISTARNESRLADILLEFCQTLNDYGLYDIRSYVKAYESEVECEFFDTRAGRCLLLSLEYELDSYIKRLDGMINCISENPECAPYGEAIASDRDFAQALRNSLSRRDYAYSKSIASSYSPQGLGSIKKEDKTSVSVQLAADRKEIKEKLLKFASVVFATNEDDIPRICKKTADFSRKLNEIVEQFFDIYAEQKLSRAICEFADLRRMASKLLMDENGNPTPIALGERERFDYIFVDEYQDTDSRQDAIFKTISRGNNLFFVGDIKQSIYGFRGAEPSLFSSYRRSYLPATIKENLDKPSLSIFMSNNFRCSPNIIKFTNTVCGYLFRESDGDGSGIGYLAEDDLVFSRTTKSSQNKVKLVMLEKGGSESDESIEYSYLISEIKRLLKDGLTPEGKPLKASDIAILTRSNYDATKVSDALGRAGIAHANSAGIDLFENPEVLLMLSLLSAIDNPQRDIPLAGVLKSSLFGFTLDDLVKVRIGRSDMSLYDAITECSEDASLGELSTKCFWAISKLIEYRTDSEAMPVHTFIRMLWRDTAALSFAGSNAETSKRTPAERRRNLRKLYDYARRFEASEFKSLHDFIDYLNGIIDEDTTISSEDGVNENTVQVMTVHKSKGLEFSVVFLVGCASHGKNAETAQMIYCDSRDLGVALNTNDDSGLGIVQSPFRLGVSKQLARDSMDEEIRVLYVALTRAKDELYIVSSGTEGFAEKRIAKAKARAEVGGLFTIMDSRGWLDRILLALMAEGDVTSYEVLNYTADDILTLGDGELETEPPSEDEILACYEKIRPVLEFKYDYYLQTDIPAKLSVSRLYPEALDEESTTEELLRKAHSFSRRTPRFMGGKEDAAEKGTATHLFMQFCDFSRLDGTVESVQEELERLIENKFVPSSIRALVRCDEIAKFTNSDLYREILEATEVHRELRFNIFLPASSFTSQLSRKEAFNDQELMVQGVIDICFVNKNGELILCDYKTDRLTPREMSDINTVKLKMKNKHGYQLSYYADAIERMMGRRPDRVCIYSLCLGDSIDIDTTTDF